MFVCSRVCELVDVFVGDVCLVASCAFCENVVSLLLLLLLLLYFLAQFFTRVRFARNF